VMVIRKAFSVNRALPFELVPRPSAGTANRTVSRKSSAKLAIVTNGALGALDSRERTSQRNRKISMTGIAGLLPANISFRSRADMAAQLPPGFFWISETLSGSADPRGRYWRRPTPRDPRIRVVRLGVAARPESTGLELRIDLCFGETVVITAVCHVVAGFQGLRASAS